MTRQQIIQNTIDIVSSVLKHCDFELKDDMTAGQIRGWDSLSHMMIISEIEKRFNVKFSFSDVLNFNTMADLFDCIQNKTSD
jgi:acyl carrier protein